MKALLIRELVVPGLLSFAFALGTASVLAQGSGAGTQNPLDDTLAPDPALSSAEVIRIQLEALRNNDEEDRGIAIAFRFASPANRANTGPLARFIPMIKRGPYVLMLDFRDATCGPVETVADRPRQRVTLTGARETMTRWFYLSRQSESPYVNCWMTDSVFVDPVRVVTVATNP